MCLQRLTHPLALRQLLPWSRLCTIGWYLLICCLVLLHCDLTKWKTISYSVMLIPAENAQFQVLAKTVSSLLDPASILSLLASRYLFLCCHSPSQEENLLAVFLCKCWAFLFYQPALHPPTPNQKTNTGSCRLRVGWRATWETKSSTPL